MTAADVDRTAPATFLEVERITVEFPGVRALDDVHFEVCAGEVHALVGENGAGKSTLLKVLGGVYVPSAGRIRLEGVDFRPAHPSDAITAGIAVIYQEFTLAPHLSAEANIYIGREPRSKFFSFTDNISKLPRLFQTNIRQLITDH